MQQFDNLNLKANFIAQMLTTVSTGREGRLTPEMNNEQHVKEVVVLAIV